MTNIDEKRQEYWSLKTFIFWNTCKVIWWFYEWQEVVIDDISMILPEQEKDWEILPELVIEYWCVFEWKHWIIKRNIDAKYLTLKK